MAGFTFVSSDHKEKLSKTIAMCIYNSLSPNGLLICIEIAVISRSKKDMEVLFLL
jgi:hypothetical protein